MDPDATLFLIRQNVSFLDVNEPGADGWEGAVDELVESFTALDTWLSKGGFFPLAWQNFGGTKND